MGYFSELDIEQQEEDAMTTNDTPTRYPVLERVVELDSTANPIFKTGPCKWPDKEEKQEYGDDLVWYGVRTGDGSARKADCDYIFESRIIMPLLAQALTRALEEIERAPCNVCDVSKIAGIIQSETFVHKDCWKATALQDIGKMLEGAQ